MIDPEEYARLDAVAQAQLVAQGGVSAEELLEAAIARVEAVNPALNAVTHRFDEMARAAVRQGLPDGPLRGVPFLLKDLHLLMEGTETTGSCALLAGGRADHDSTLVARYKRAGLVIFGKTNTPELGLTVSTEPLMYGATRNPWHTAHSAGGSSGGAAAAVAAGIVPAANASDGGGSIRIPASCCGLFGLKPTRARTPAGPDRGEGWSGMSCNHVISRTVRDSAALLDATAGDEAGAPYCCAPQPRPFLSALERPGPRLRIAFSARAPNGAEVDPECVRAVENAASLCRELGHEVEEGTPPFDAAGLGPAMMTIIGANTRALLTAAARAKGRDVGPDDMEPLTWRMLGNAAAAEAARYVEAVNAIHAAGRVAADFHRRYDVYASPVLSRPPLPLGVLAPDAPDPEAYARTLVSYSAFTAYQNMTGEPSMSVPLHWTADGLPVGVMFSAAFGGEETLLALAGELESARPWAGRRPPAAD
ncbi:MAG TPA: amidase family protein [Gammaproteobacteria bacterium]|nr:amidase family protein [Gammaproteobacteria bacterium]